MNNRKEHLISAIPDLLQYKTILYIGARPGRMQMLDLFLNANYYITILEIFEPNVEELIKMNQNKRIFDNIQLGNVEKINDYGFENFDIIMWWHGPEHIPYEKLEDVIKQLENKANHYVIMGSPFGLCRQGLCYGNKYERHISLLYPNNFEKWGYQIKTDGEQDVRAGHILSWKKINR
jgi:hypothetical protein